MTLKTFQKEKTANDTITVQGFVTETARSYLFYVKKGFENWALVSSTVF